MGQAVSVDLRAQVVAEVAAGASSGGVAVQGERFLGDPLGGVEGRDRPGRSPAGGGKSRSPLEPHAAWLLALVEREADLTLAELGRRIEEGAGLKTTEASIRRFSGLFYQRRIHQNCLVPELVGSGWR